MIVAVYSDPHPSSPTAVDGAHPTTPPLRCDVCPLLAEYLEPRQQAGYSKCMPQHAGTRVPELQAELDLLRAQLRLRERQLFGRKPEPAPAHLPDQSTVLPAP